MACGGRLNPGHREFCERLFDMLKVLKSLLNGTSERFSGQFPRARWCRGVVCAAPAARYRAKERWKSFPKSRIKSTWSQHVQKRCGTWTAAVARGKRALRRGHGGNMVTPPTLTQDMVEAFDLCPTVILVFEIEGFRIVAANAAAARKYGRTKEDLTTMTIMDLRPSEEVPRITILASRMMDDADAAGRSRHLNGAGEEFIAEVTTQVVEMNGRLCKLSVIHDVTDLVAREEKARALTAAATESSRAADATARHFAELFNIAPGRCAVLGPRSFEVIAVSDRYLDAVGMQRAEMIGQPLVGLLAGRPTQAGADAPDRMRASLGRVART